MIGYGGKVETKFLDKGWSRGRDSRSRSESGIKTGVGVEVGVGFRNGIKVKSMCRG